MKEKYIVKYNPYWYGGMLAIMLSYAINQSLCWAFLHCLFGWFYVLYWLGTYTDIFEFIREFVVV